MIKAPLHLICLLVAIAGLSGCINLEPKPDQTQIFALAAEVELASKVTDEPAIYIARVELPGFLDGTRIFYRGEDGGLGSFADARWAEEPSEALPRALAVHLQATGSANVYAYYPWANKKTDAKTLFVQFERFSGNGDGVVEVIARWQIQSGEEITSEGRFMSNNLEWALNAADYVAALDAGLAQLTKAIAQEL